MDNGLAHHSVYKMSYGLVIRNGASELLIDNDHSNYVEWSSGSVYVTTSFASTPAYFPSTVDRLPLIFIQCTSPIFIAEIIGSGASITGVRFGTFIGSLSPGWPSGFAATCYYQLFLPASKLGASVESHGLRLFDGSGNIVYDSGRVAMQPRAYGAYTRPAWSGAYAGVEQLFPVSGFSSTPWVLVNPFAGPLKYLVGAAPLRGYTEAVRAVDASNLGVMFGGSYAGAGSDPGTAFVNTGVQLPLIAIP